MLRTCGSTLLVLVVFVFASLIRHGREFRMRSRWMLIFSGARKAYRRIRPERRDAGGADHVHRAEPVHTHALDDEGGALAVAEDLPVSEWHHGQHGRPGHPARQQP